MFEVVVRYWMQDTRRYLTDALGVPQLLATLDMAAIQNIAIEANRGD